VCTLLGYEGQILLRPTRSNNFLVVGECYMHGLGDAASFLGPLPVGTVVQIFPKTDVGRTYRFVNSSEGTDTIEDPRLPPLPAEWERFEKEFDPNDSPVCDWFRNIKTGEEMDSDPRMLTEALKARGVPLRTFRLV
jgi:hypothetical protein